MPYSKNGSHPIPEMLGNRDGWIEVEEAPIAPEGKEVVWWYPPGWVIRDVKPESRDGYVWKWNQDLSQWIEYEIVKPVEEQPVLTQATVDTQNLTSTEILALSTTDLGSLVTDQIQPLTTEQL